MRTEEEKLTRTAVETVRGWAALLFGALLIWLFVFEAAPRLQNVRWVKTVHVNVRKSGIDAAAIYYTDIEEFSAAERFMRDSRDYGPEGSKE